MTRVTEIRYVCYGVPDLQAERAFDRDQWGLREVAEVEGMIYFAAEGTDERYVVRLRQSDQKLIGVVAIFGRSHAQQACPPPRPTQIDPLLIGCGLHPAPHAPRQ